MMREEPRLYPSKAAQPQPTPARRQPEPTPPTARGSGRLVGLSILAGVLLLAVMANMSQPAKNSSAPPTATQKPLLNCAEFAGYSSCAVGAGGILGKLTASGLSCQFGAERMLKLGQAGLVAIRSVALSKADFQDAFRLMSAAGQETARRSELGLERTDCRRLDAEMASLERKLGLR